MYSAYRPQPGCKAGELWNSSAEGGEEVDEEFELGEAGEEDALEEAFASNLDEKEYVSEDGDVLIELWLAHGEKDEEFNSRECPLAHSLDRFGLRFENA